MSFEAVFYTAAVILAVVLFVRIFAGPRNVRAMVLANPMGHYMRARDSGATPAQAMFAALAPLRYREPWRGLSDDTLRGACEVLSSGLTIDPFKALILQVEGTRDANWITNQAYLLGLVASDIGAHGAPFEQDIKNLNAQDIRNEMSDDDEEFEDLDDDDDLIDLDDEELEDLDEDNKSGAKSSDAKPTASSTLSEPEWQAGARAIVGSGTYSLEGAEDLQLARLVEWLRKGVAAGFDWRQLYDAIYEQWHERRPNLPKPASMEILIGRG